MSDRLEIERAIEAFAASFRAGDLAAVLDHYDDDLVKARHGSEDESKSQLAARLEPAFQRFQTDVQVENLEVEVSGDLAFTRGTFTVTLTPRDGSESPRSTRRYLEIWRKSAGRWRVARTMDNFSQ